MITQKQIYLVAFLLLSSLGFSEAFVQVIHNSADPAAASVDVYVNGAKPDALNDFEYKDATSYIPLPAGVDIVVTIAAPSSTTVTEGVIDTFNLGQLEDGESYVVVANGIVAEVASYNNPDQTNRSIAFDLEVFAGGTTAETPGTVDLNVFHGVTDAPAVDIYLKRDGDEYPAEPQIPALDYKQSSGFVALAPATWIVKVTAAGNPDVVVGEYQAPISTASGFKVNVLATGFLTPEDENGGINGYDFGLIAATPLGSAFLLPEVVNEFASVQIIHNAADPAASVVDIYIMGEKPSELDDINFREATTYLEVDANTPLVITINESESTSAIDALLTTVQLPALEANGNYVVVANGVIGDDFMNPDMERNIDFDLYAVGGKTESGDENTVSLNVWHGATDAPSVDIYANDGTDPLIAGLDYGNASDWTDLPNEDVTLTVTASGNSEVVAGVFTAPLSQFGGQSLFAFASGFLTTDDEPVDVTGNEFGIFVATASGDVVQLPAVVIEPDPDPALVQVIHNSANPAANQVDVYINGAKPAELDDFTFRTATPYLEVPSGSSLTISVNLPSSTFAGDGVVKTFEIPALEENGEYILVANGSNVLEGDDFMSGAEGRDISFNLFPLAGKTTGDSDSEVSINVWHGSTDAPAVDIYADITGEPLVPNLDYGNASGWTNVPNEDITLTLTVAGNVEAVAGEFAAPLSSFGGQSLFIFASGFLTTDDEPVDVMENGFGLFVATSGGDVVELSPVTSVFYNNVNTSVFPNPATSSVNITSEDKFNNIRIIDVNGNNIDELNINGNNSYLLNTDNLNSGKYFIILTNDNEMVSVEEIVISK